METPDQHSPDHEQHYDVSKMDQSSPMNMLWGLILALLTFLLVVICVLTVRMISNETDDWVDPNDPSTPTEPTTPTDPSTPTDPTTPTDPSTSSDPVEKSYLIKRTSDTQTIPHRDSNSNVGIHSDRAIVVDVSNQSIIADYDADGWIFPASMTKVMTMLVASEHLEEDDYADYVLMSQAIVDDMAAENASGIGLKAGEELTVEDLFYLTALESDGAAACQLAEYVAGSQEAFVQMMNDKCREMGLQRTHFANVTGLHNNNHYTTPREMASIMLAALDNERVAEYMRRERYLLKTNLREDYIVSTYYEDLAVERNYFSLPDGARVVAAKTGLTDEAGYCLACCVASISGKRYVVITSDATTPGSYCADLQYIYRTYANLEIYSATTN